MPGLTAPAIDEQEYRTRVRRVRAAMEEKQLDALVTYANRTHPGHTRFLTGYEPRLGIHDSALCVLSPRDCWLLTNAGFDLPSTRTWLADATVTARYGVELARRLPDGALRIGVAGFPAFPAPAYIELLSLRPELSLVDASTELLELRRVKSAAEIELLRTCAAITDAGGRAFAEWARRGISEREVATRMEAAMKRAGSDEVSFATQVCSGDRTAQVVAFATDHVLRQDELVQFDCGATYQGYRGDLSRARLTERTGASRHRELLEITAEMYDRCLELMRPGVRCSEIALLAQRIARAYGVEHLLYRSPNHEGGFVGHGIGLSYSEPPELHPASDAYLEEGMVMVLEPILAEPGVGGVKIEDTVLITERGPERWSSLPVRI